MATVTQHITHISVLTLIFVCNCAVFVFDCSHASTFGLRQLFTQFSINILQLELI
jgi:hypothetical protein